MVRRLAFFMVVAGACAGAPEPPPRPGKPHAPVELELTARSVADGVYEVTFEGRALADVASLNLELALPDGAVLDGGERVLSSGMTVRGGAHRLVARVRAPAGTKIAGLARSSAGGRATSLLLGGAVEKAAIPPAARVITTPFGPVAESR